MWKHILVCLFAAFFVNGFIIDKSFNERTKVRGFEQELPQNYLCTNITGNQLVMIENVIQSAQQLYETNYSQQSLLINKNIQNLGGTWSTVVISDVSASSANYVYVARNYMYNAENKCAEFYQKYNKGAGLNTVHSILKSDIKILPSLQFDTTKSSSANLSQQELSEIRSFIHDSVRDFDSIFFVPISISNDLKATEILPSNQQWNVIVTLAQSGGLNPHAYITGPASKYAVFSNEFTLVNKSNQKLNIVVWTSS